MSDKLGSLVDTILSEQVFLSSRIIEADLESRIPSLIQLYLNTMMKKGIETNEQEAEQKIRELNQLDPTGTKAEFTPAITKLYLSDPAFDPERAGYLFKVLDRSRERHDWIKGFDVMGYRTLDELEQALEPYIEKSKEIDISKERVEETTEKGVVEWREGDWWVLRFDNPEDIVEFLKARGLTRTWCIGRLNFARIHAPCWFLIKRDSVIGVYSDYDEELSNRQNKPTKDKNILRVFTKYLKDIGKFDKWYKFKTKLGETLSTDEIEEIITLGDEQTLCEIYQKFNLTPEQVNKAIDRGMCLDYFYYYQQLTPDQIDKALEKGLYLDYLYEFQQLTPDQIDKALEKDKNLYELYRYQELTPKQVDKAIEKNKELSCLYKHQKLIPEQIDRAIDIGKALNYLYGNHKLTPKQIDKAIEKGEYLYYIYEFQKLTPEQIDKAIEKGEDLDYIYLYQELTPEQKDIIRKKLKIKRASKIVLSSNFELNAGFGTNITLSTRVIEADLESRIPSLIQMYLSAMNKKGIEINEQEAEQKIRELNQIDSTGTKAEFTPAIVRLYLSDPAFDPERARYLFKVLDRSRRRHDWIKGFDVMGYRTLDELEQALEPYIEKSKEIDISKERVEETTEKGVVEWREGDWWVLRFDNPEDIVEFLKARGLTETWCIGIFYCAMTCAPCWFLMRGDSVIGVYSNYDKELSDRQNRPMKDENILKVFVEYLKNIGKKDLWFKFRLKIDEPWSEKEIEDAITLLSKKFQDEDYLRMFYSKVRLTPNQIDKALDKGRCLDVLYRYQQLTPKQVDKAIEKGKELKSLYKYQKLTPEQVDKVLEEGNLYDFDILYIYQKLTPKQVDKALEIGEYLAGDFLRYELYRHHKLTSEQVDKAIELGGEISLLSLYQHQKLTSEQIDKAIDKGVALDYLYKHQKLTPEQKKRIEKKLEKNRTSRKVLSSKIEPIDTQQNKPFTVAVDFDGVIVKQTTTEGGEIAELVSGTKEALEKLKNLGIRIIIFTAREDQDNIQKFLEDNGIPYDEINANVDIENLSEKVVADVCIDDRAFRFKGDWQEVIDFITKGEYKTWLQQKGLGNDEKEKQQLTKVKPTNDVRTNIENFDKVASWLVQESLKKYPEETLVHEEQVVAIGDKIYPRKKTPKMTQNSVLIHNHIGLEPPNSEDLYNFKQLFLKKQVYGMIVLGSETGHYYAITINENEPEKFTQFLKLSLSDIKRELNEDKVSMRGEEEWRKAFLRFANKYGIKVVEGYQNIKTSVIINQKSKMEAERLGKLFDELYELYKRRDKKDLEKLNRIEEQLRLKSISGGTLLCLLNVDEETFEYDIKGRIVNYYPSMKILSDLELLEKEYRKIMKWFSKNVILFVLSFAIASFDYTTKTIRFDIVNFASRYGRRMLDKIYGTLLHELEHYIQYVYGKLDIIEDTEIKKWYRNFPVGELRERFIEYLDRFPFEKQAYISDIVKLYNRGYTVEQIAEIFGVQVEDIEYLLKEHQYQREGLEARKIVSILKRKYRKDTDRTEWVLVSRDGKRVLKWFGPQKPSKEMVQKEERRVQYFKHKKGSNILSTRYNY